MGLFSNFPYSDFESINLDWIIRKVKEYLDKVDRLNIDFITLKEYVTNYFDNLDIQEEVNNKLDDMASSGQLAEIISQYLQSESLITFNTIADMVASDNLINNLDVLCIGKLEYNDGYTNLYKIRTLTSSDVVDGVNIIALTNYPTLIAELLKKAENKRVYNSFNELKEDTSLISGDIVNTIGYYAIGDGGQASYIISDTQEGYSTLIDNGLYANLLIKDYVTPQMFGAKCDGTDDKAYLDLACQYAISTKTYVLITKDMSISGTIELLNFLKIKGNNVGIELTKLDATPLFEAISGNKFYIEIKDLHLNGANNNTNCFNLGDGGNTTLGFTNCIFENLYLENFGNFGIMARGNVLTLEMRNLWIANCGNSGIYTLGHDCQFTNIYAFNNCTTKNFGNLYLGGAMNHFDNIKAYLGGNPNDQGSGGITIAAAGSTFSNIDSQENYNFGIAINGATNTLTNIVCDHCNGVGAAGGTGIRFNTSGSKNTVIGTIRNASTGVVFNAANNFVIINHENVTTVKSGTSTPNILYANGVAA